MVTGRVIRLSFHVLTFIDRSTTVVILKFLNLRRTDV